MRVLIASAVLAASCGTAFAQPATPDLKGTWIGEFRTVIFGNNVHHPGENDVTSPPRIREIAFTIDVEGQDGALFWGHSWSDPATKEPFAGSLAPGGTTAIAADTDGSMTMSVTGDTRMDVCYSHTGLGPSGSIVVSCGSLMRTD
jgi:hypothetical protein